MIEESDLIPDPDGFRFKAVLKKALGKPLTEEEREVIREVNRIQGWDKDDPR